MTGSAYNAIWARGSWIWTVPSVRTAIGRPCSVERRFELWLGEFAGEPLSAIKTGVEWDHYQELRRRRNDLMHPAHSILGFGLKDAARQLNLVRRGVGGLLNRLRGLQKLPSVPFAERLETAPETRFHPDASSKPDAATTAAEDAAFENADPIADQAD